MDQILIKASADAVAKSLSLKGENDKSEMKSVCPINKGTFSFN